MSILTFLDTNIRYIPYTLLLMVSFVLTACSGGGGGGTPAALTFTSGGNISVLENTTFTGYTATATDADGDTVTYSLTGGADKDLFTIDSSSGVLSFNNAPDFEIPADSDTNNAYLIEIRATDGANSIMQSVTVTVTDVNENPAQNTPPDFTSGSAMLVIEGSTATGYTTTATDADGDTISFSLTGGDDQADFNINGRSGLLTFKSASSFGTPVDSNGDNIYDIEISASDGTNTVAINVSITVLNVDDPPVFISGTAVSVTEGTLATGYTATVASGQSVNFSLSGGADQADFRIDPVSGVLTFKSIPGFETPMDSNGDNVYDIVIAANDGVHLVTLRVTVTVTRMNEAPVFTSGAAVSVPEGATATGYTATATDEDGDSITFSLTGGADQADFNINSSSGVLTFKSVSRFDAPVDSNGDNVYDIEISASDGTSTVVRNVSITVLNVNEAPIFTSGTVESVSEGSTATGYTATATDADGDPISFSLTGGVDQADFNINSSGGVLTFKSASSFETPADSNSDNVYDIEISASDGTSTVVRNVSITVLNVNEPPVFTSGTAVSVSEGATSTGYTATATDADGDPITFSLTSGADQAAFSINASSGILSFKTAQDFEMPTDSDSNNTYVVVISASDGTNSTSRTVTVTITDVLEVSVSTLDIKTIQFNWSAFGGATGYKLFVNPDGVSGFSLLQDNIVGISTAIEVPVHLTDWVNASYMVEAHNGLGKLTESEPMSIISLMISNIGYFKASNTGADDRFGRTVSISADGNTLAVGAFSESSSATGIGGNQFDNSLIGSGAVYVFSRSGSTWSQQAYVKASNTDQDDNFGRIVSLSADGNTLAVSARGEDSNASGIGGNQIDNSLSDSGAVYVFSRSGSNWSQQAYVKASNTGAYDWFGWAVSLSADGNTLAVGAFSEDSSATGIGGNQFDNSLIGSGAVYVFSRSGITWSQQAYVKASNTGTSDWFGYDVSLSSDGNTLAVGAILEDSMAIGIGGNQSDDSVNGSGAVYLFSRSGITWSQQAYVKASNTGLSDQLGWAVSLSADGNTLAVSATNERSNATGIDGDQSDNSLGSSGAMYVFSRSGSTWSQQSYVKASNTGAGDLFGRAVSLSADGNTLAVGANGEASNATGIGGEQSNDLSNGSGAVYVFSRSGSTWTQQAYVKASNTGSGDLFGFAVSLSADGNALAVGTIQEDSNATGIGSNQSDNSLLQSGAVHLY